MYIRKNTSGLYAVQKMINGNRYNTTFDHKPSKKEIDMWVAELSINTPKSPKNVAKMNFDEAVHKYISVNENVLSPTTIRSYESVLRNLSEDFKKIELVRFDEDVVQKEINDYSVGRSPKTVRNAYGLIVRVLGIYRKDLHLKCNLPQKEKKKETYIPTPAEAKAIIEEVKGTKYEIAFRLGCYGLRRSEVLALQYPDDLDGNILTVNKALVQDKDNNWVVKTTKTTDSTREIYISDELVALIHERQAFFDGYGGKINQRLHEVQKKLGIEKFRLHDLRGYFATELSQAGLSEADILRLGGWSKTNSDVMKNVYRHSRIQGDLEAMKNASKIINM